VSSPNIQQIAEYSVAKHAAEKNAHGVVGAIMGQNHGHTGGSDGAQIQHSNLLGLAEGGHLSTPESHLRAFAAAHG
jgi:hypothetical protein